jgi:hypothetical protein
LEETTVDFLSTGPVNNPFILSEIVKGQTYNVIWDGVLYECVAYIASGPNAPSIGNGSIANVAGGGNEPFFIAIFNGSVLAFVSEAGTHTISISSTINQEIVKLPSKYLQNSNIINGEGSGSLKTIGATKASGQYSFAEGYNTTASKEYSHAEGQKTTASAIAAHVEGISNTASGQAAHAEGYHTTANGL